MQLSFARARLEDIGAILQLLADDDLKKLTPDEVNDQHRRAFAAIEQDASQYLLTGWLGNDIVATAQISFIPGLSRNGMLRAWVEGVRVSRAMRGNGLGQQMFDHIFEVCRARGAGLVQLMMDRRRERAGHFYERLGFQRQHDGFRLYL